MKTNKEQRFIGCLAGLAIGDAVGTTLEFHPKGTFSPINDMLGGGPFDLAPGQWTDDTSMALCLAESLRYKQCFDPVDQMNRYCNWWQWGYMSSTDTCFDIGNTVLNALKKYLSTKNPFSGDAAPDTAGNGSLMRLAPIPMFYSNNLVKVIHYSGESSRTTHAAEECIDSCRYFGALLYSALNGNSKEEILHFQGYQPSSSRVKNIFSRNYQSKKEAEVYGSGYVINSLEAALWSFYVSDSFEEAILTAANLGDDADTTAAICGQIAGAYYGYEKIPNRWKDLLFMRAEIIELAKEIYSSSKKI